MPQGRRKTPFSGKQKKVQLQQKKERKYYEHSADATIVSALGASKRSSAVDVINAQSSTSSKGNRNRYRLMFKKETDEEVQRKRLLAQKPFDPVPPENLEVHYEEVFLPGSELDMPKRPMWNYSLSKEKLDAQEQRYFREYIEDLEKRFGDKELSHFEMNLETWRQLWRVLEFSDIVLLVVDIRYSVYHYSPALYDYVTKELKKDIILVLNKIDLVPAPLVLAWKTHLKNHFPNLKILCFASYAGMKEKEGKKGKRIGNLHMAIEGSRQLLHICEEIVQEEVNLTSWRKKIEAEAAQIKAGDEYYVIEDKFEDSDSDDDRKVSRTDKTAKHTNDTSYYQGKRFQDNILTIGFIGHPNVGKSSFLNAVLGRKVVSVSKTPGHTKHYQTIMLTPNVRLCDCPGLVFPSLVPKPVQVLMGCYPIAQLREPYSAIEFLAQRVPVTTILKLQHPNIDSDEESSDIRWSSHDVCEAWALKRGFLTAKVSRPDVYRAANNILRMALDGRTLCLAFRPTNYTKQEEMWSTHRELDDIITIQASRGKKEERVKGQQFEEMSGRSRCGYELDSSNESSGKSDSDSDEDKSDGTLEQLPDNKFASLGDDVNC